MNSNVSASKQSFPLLYVSLSFLLICCESFMLPYNLSTRNCTTGLAIIVDRPSSSAEHRSQPIYCTVETSKLLWQQSESRWSTVSWRDSTSRGAFLFLLVYFFTVILPGEKTRSRLSVDCGKHASRRRSANPPPSSRSISTLDVAFSAAFGDRLCFRTRRTTTSSAHTPSSSYFAHRLHILVRYTTVSQPARYSCRLWKQPSR